MVTILKAFFPLLFIYNHVLSAPAKERSEVEETRQAKSLPFYEYYQPEEIDYSSYDAENDDYVGVDIDENELSRTIPSRKRYNVNRPQQPYNSPIYYIRMPPQPYMFIPGLGYVSQPPLHHMSQFLNVPVSFVANGKPSTIYQWSGGLEQFPGATIPSQPLPILPPITPPKPKPKPQPPKPADSTVHHLPGKFQFNGKPEDIYVLRDSYNSLYSDALQNFYP